MRERELDGGEVELTAVAAALPARAVLEDAAGRPLEGWEEEDVPADWRARRARFGGGAFLVAGRLLVCSPWDPPAERGVLDLVLARGGSGFGSGSHSTTRMCLELLLDLAPIGGAPISAAASGRWRSRRRAWLVAGGRSRPHGGRGRGGARERRAQRRRRRVAGRRPRIGARAAGRPSCW